MKIAKAFMEGVDAEVGSPGIGGRGRSISWIHDPTLQLSNGVDVTGVILTLSSFPHVPQAFLLANSCSRHDQ
jgi:hypothetical protein